MSHATRRRETESNVDECCMIDNQVRRCMNEEGKRALKIFLEFWLLIGLLAAFNLYSYFRGGSKMFLVVGIICVFGFIGWGLFYVFYVRRGSA
jgi:hypothetical protein